jgi:S1-C subfamily serine protease
MASSVQVNCPSLHGTGAFIAPGLVVTAAHVVHPRSQVRSFPANRIMVRLPDGTPIKATAVWCHHRWEQDFRPTSDIALVRVSQRPSIVFARRMDVAARRLAVAVLGFREGPRAGTVTRVADPDGHDSFDSSDLSYHAGVSGAPIVDDGGRAIGIATRSGDFAMPDAFIGLPFIDDNLGWLLRNAP